MVEQNGYKVLTFYQEDGRWHGYISPDFQTARSRCENAPALHCSLVDLDQTTPLQFRLVWRQSDILLGSKKSWPSLFQVQKEVVRLRQLPRIAAIWVVEIVRGNVWNISPEVINNL